MMSLDVSIALYLIHQNQTPQNINGKEVPTFHLETVLIERILNAFVFSCPEQLNR